MAEEEEAVHAVFSPFLFFASVDIKPLWYSQDTTRIVSLVLMVSVRDFASYRTPLLSLKIIPSHPVA